MHGHRGGERTMPEPRDEGVSVLLGSWKAPDPPADFEAAVWRRIQGVHAAETGPLRGLHGVFGPSWAWLNALAAAAGIIVGITLSFWTVARHERLPITVTWPHSQTLAGSYLAAVSGDKP